MKIKTIKLSYDEVMALPKPKHVKPKKPNMLFRSILKAASKKDLKDTNFSLTEKNMNKLGPNEPAMFLMNHSSFIDLKIAATILYPRAFNIICTSDGFVGQEWLMRNLGCIPTKKFITDIVLVKDMLYAVNTLKSSILMYPEASYSFDGTATPLPEGLSKCLKLLGIPVVMIKTEGAFSRDPLYNNLQLRDVNVSATMEYILSPKDIEELSNDEIMEILNKHFTFDNFKWQQDNSVCINKSFRADGLNRVLYKCPACQTEGKMLGKGTKIKCQSCGKEWELDEYGFLKAVEGEVFFNHVPDWYSWERQCVKEELENGTYKLDIPVDIRMMVDMNYIYEVGEGRLVHDIDGFHLTGADGKINYHHRPSESYSLYADYFWYEIGDMICIGNNKALYYCFPKSGDVVAKTRLATEELYKITQKKKLNK